MSTSAVQDVAQAAFLTWAESGENTNCARFTQEKYDEYISMLTFPDAKPPQHIVDQREGQKWSNSRSDAIEHYQLRDGRLWRKADRKYPQR